MSFRITVACTRAQGEAIAVADDILPNAVLVADEPDPANPDDWLIHAYFEHPPREEEIARVAKLGNAAPCGDEQLGEDDWVTMSQAGLQPIRSGRFTVHTPTYAPDLNTINFEIDAGLSVWHGSACDHSRLPGDAR